MQLFKYIRSLLLWTGMLLCPGIPAVGQQLYWSDFGADSAALASVGHVALDGTGSVVVHRTSFPLGMATNNANGQTYWLEGAGSVVASNADLSNPHALSAPTGSGVLNLAIDPAADIVLWTAYSNSTIERARLSDGTPLGSFATGGQGLEDIAVDPTSHKVYWTDANSKISRANYDGTGQELLAGTAGELGTGAAGIDLDLSAGKMYLAYPNANTIIRRNLDGSGAETVLTLSESERPFGMELYGGRMYWCDNDNGLLRSATTNGTDVKTVLSGLDSPRAVSVSTFVVPLAGDYNGNGFVDAADYTIWRDTLGSTTDLRANGDNTSASAGKIDEADFTIWKANFGTQSGSGASANAAPAHGAVPEPSSLMLMLAASLVCVAFRSRRI